MDVQEMWKQILKMLENSIAEVVYDTMIGNLTLVSFENGNLKIMAKNDFFRETIASRHIHEITRCVRSLAGEDVEITILSPETKNDVLTVNNKSPNYEKTNLRLRYTFETFVPGKCNELAYAAARAVSESLGLEEYNPLFLYGDVGLGKTHLIHSIGNYVVDNFPKLRVMYVSSATFTDDYITSLREKTTPDFRKKYRKLDVLLVDDVQFLSGKKETQEEMFHTFNFMYNLSKQIVFTSDVPPRELKDLEDRLTNRFTSGLIADVNIPDYETRTAILEKKLSIEKLDVPNNVKEFIIQNIVSNIRDMEGALNKVMAYARLTNKPLTLELAQHALKDQLVKASRPPITMEYIREVVATRFKISVDEMQRKKRAQSVVLPRQIAMYLCRKIMDVSVLDIGKFFGKDHSTVIHACNKISGEMETDEKMRLTLEDLEIKIKCE